MIRKIIWEQKLNARIASILFVITFMTFFIVNVMIFRKIHIIGIVLFALPPLLYYRNYKKHNYVDWDNNLVVKPKMIIYLIGIVAIDLSCKLFILASAMFISDFFNVVDVIAFIVWIAFIIAVLLPIVNMVKFNKQRKKLMSLVGFDNENQVFRDDIMFLILYVEIIIFACFVMVIDPLSPITYEYKYDNVLSDYKNIDDYKELVCCFPDKIPKNAKNIRFYEFRAWLSHPKMCLEFYMNESYIEQCMDKCAGNMEEFELDEYELLGEFLKRKMSVMNNENIYFMNIEKIEGTSGMVVNKKMGYIFYFLFE